MPVIPRSVLDFDERAAEPRSTDEGRKGFAERTSRLLGRGDGRCDASFPSSQPATEHIANARFNSESSIPTELSRWVTHSPLIADPGRWYERELKLDPIARSAVRSANSSTGHTPVQRDILNTPKDTAQVLIFYTFLSLARLCDVSSVV